VSDEERDERRPGAPGEDAADDDSAARAEDAAAGPPPADDAPEQAPAEGQPAADDAPEQAPAEGQPAAEREEEQPAGDAEDAPADDSAPAEQPPAEDADDATGGEQAEPVAGQAEQPAPEQPAAAGDAAERPERPRRRKDKQGAPDEEVIPGAHLEPDLVLEAEEQAAGDIAEYAEVEVEAGEEVAAEQPEGLAEGEPQPAAHQPVDLAADARYPATGKRKSAVARVILRPGSGTYTINGRHLDEIFPRIKLQMMAKQPLEAAGYQSRMDVVARVHGGGVSSQAGALRHGIARALVEADPALRVELKRRGYLTRDPRVKERKKAGLKKARKRPQFSKR
jgi:small subunit ribosomal protein S9